MSILTSRWTQLDYHAEQQRYFSSQTRFNIAHAGRRGGKTEIAKRRMILRALDCERPNGRFVFGAPTHRQAIDIFWEDAIALIPRWALRKQTTQSISVSYRRIKLYNGAAVEVFGLDKPERIEGPPLDGFVGDEFGNFKPGVWSANIRPALSTLNRPGYADLIGVPEGKNHYFDLTKDAESKDDWDIFTWHTSEINPVEADAARDDLDAMTYSQEYGGEFLSFRGAAYHTFDAKLNCPPDGERMLYDPSRRLCFCFDFNRIPGTCVILQELPAPEWLIKRNSGRDIGLITCVIDEIFILNGSTTEKVCNILLERWKSHDGIVGLYGDASGGAKTSQSVAGSDWDIILEKLSPYFKIEKCWPKANPPVRARINSTNSRLCSSSGLVHTIIDHKCKYLIRDLESVSCDDAGEIPQKDKKSLLTHISDCFSYYCHTAHPFGRRSGSWSVKEV